MIPTFYWAYVLNFAKFVLYFVPCLSFICPVAPPSLHHGVIRDCMKGVYENEETHLSKALAVPSKPELVKISMKDDG